MKPEAALPGKCRLKGIGNVSFQAFRRRHMALAVQSELLRHADIRTTMSFYTQPVPDEKRAPS